jgi:GxxExxY protein
MAIRELIEARLTHSVIGAFFEVYNTLGPGFLESVYSKALEVELTTRGHHVAREVVIRVYYKGHLIGSHRLDMVVDHKLLIENKSSLELHSVAARQVESCLQASKLPVALLLHVGPQPRLRRIVRLGALKDQANSAVSEQSV